MTDKNDLASQRSRNRYTVDLPCTLDQKITRIAEEQGVSKSDLLREAVRVFCMYDQLNRDGYQVGGWRDLEQLRETVRIPVGFS